MRRMDFLGISSSSRCCWRYGKTHLGPGRRAGRLESSGLLKERQLGGFGFRAHKHPGEQEEAQTGSRGLAAGPRLDHHGDVDDRDLASFDFTRLQDRDPSGRRRRWAAGRRRTEEGERRPVASFGKPGGRLQVPAAQCFRCLSVLGEEGGALGAQIIAFLFRRDMEQRLR